MFACRICDGETSQLFKSFKPRDGELRIKASGSSKLSTNLHKCLSCGHVLQYPEHPKQLIQALYENESDDEFIKYNPQRITTFKYCINRLIEKGILKLCDNCLDIGSAGGAFLEAAKQKELSALGIEPSDHLSAFARSKYGVDVRTGFLKDILPSIDQQFDCVFFWDVLEHIYDVNHDIEICSDLISDEGHIVVNIPDIESLSAKILRQNWPMYLDVHLHFFTRKSLGLLMAKHGFSLCDDWAHKQSLPLDYIAKRGFSHLFGDRAGTLAGWITPRLNVWYQIGQRCYVFKRTDI